MFQTTYWGNYLASYLGSRPHYLVIRDGGEVVGQLMLLEMLRGQEVLEAAVGGRVKRLLAPMLKVFNWREGPVVRQGLASGAVVGGCLETVQALARQRNVTGIEEVSPPFGGTGGVGAAFSEARFVAERRATIRVDVRMPLEALWSRLKADVARTPIRKAEKQGVSVRRLERLPEVDEFCALVAEWRADNGFPPYRPERYRDMFKHLRPHCEFFLAEHEGRAVGCVGLLHFNGQAQLFTPVQSRIAREAKIYVGDLLYWELIRWCHERGLAVLDLGGVAVSPSDDKEAGIRRFKEKWGGDLFEYAVFTRVLKPGRWTAANLMRRLRRGLWPFRPSR
ncbi:MAG: GNAT family N-acetyltransferase [Candidatus Rokubacteria bacterium]|nr:GNAT family N-acetyltransferase [Candidatus Rokubacteria bacterium]